MSTEWEETFHRDLQSALTTVPDPRSAPLACDEERVFRGSLDRLPLAEIVRLLHESRKSGVLVLTHGAQEDRIFLRRGEVLAATAGATRGVAAFNRLLQRDTGHFRFEARRVHPARTVYEPTEELLAAGALRANGAAGALPPALEAALPPGLAKPTRSTLISWTLGRGSSLVRALHRAAASVPALPVVGPLAAPVLSAERVRRRDLAVVGGAAALLLSTGIVAALSGHPTAQEPAQPRPAAVAPAGDAHVAAIRARNARTRAELDELERRVRLLSGSVATALPRDGAPSPTQSPRAVAPRPADPDDAAAALSLSPLRRH